MSQNTNSKKLAATKTSKRKSHARFLRYASLHSVNSASATISREDAARMVRQYLESEAAL
jgi:hypothetical protein